MIDNCYSEFVEKTSPLEVGADIIVGSLIKNLGASIASNGAYICGKKELVNLCAERLNLPGEGADVGPSLGANKSFLQGLYFAPSVVASSLKIAVLTSYLMEHLGFEVDPKYNEERVDIVENIIFHDNDKEINIIEASEQQMRSIRGAKIAMIFQEPMTSLNPVIKCGEQVTEAILLHTKVSKKEAHDKVIELFKEVMLPRPEKIFDS